MRFEAEMPQNQMTMQAEGMGGPVLKMKWPAQPQGASQGPLRRYTTDAGKDMHAQDAADHKRRRDLGHMRDAEGSNHSCRRSESYECAGYGAD